MARHHIESLNAQELPWKPTLLPGMAGAQEKRLSEDEETGAVSLLLLLPPGWRQETSGYRNAPEEFFIIDGDLNSGERTLIAGCYSYIPAGMVRGPLSSERGCFALVFIDGLPDYVVSTTSRADAKIEQFIPCINTTEMEWQDGNAPALRFKPLREDPETHDWSWIVGALPFWREDRAEIHPTVEEAFCLHGEVLLGSRGVMRAGDYFWRPPNIEHGPLISKTGGLWFFRTKGGSLKIDYTELPDWRDMVDNYLRAAPLFSAKP